jgi:hypothetical protein
MKGYSSQQKRIARIAKHNLNKFAVIECKSQPGQVLYLRLKQRHIQESLSGEVTSIKLVTDKEQVKELMRLEAVNLVKPVAHNAREGRVSR